MLKIRILADFKQRSFCVAKTPAKGVPSMGGNSAVKVRYALGSRKH
jgi:hypothetical protein